MVALIFPVTTAAEFRARFPEFTTLDYSDATIEIALEDAALQINPCVWGTKAGLGQIYLAAHSLALFGPSSVISPGPVVGPVASETVGEVSRSYASPYVSGTTGSDFALTRYGQLYERLARTVMSTPIVI